MGGRVRVPARTVRPALSTQPLEDAEGQRWPCSPHRAHQSHWHLTWTEGLREPSHATGIPHIPTGAHQELGSFATNNLPTPAPPPATLNSEPGEEGVLREQARPASAPPFRRNLPPSCPRGAFLQESHMETSFTRTHLPQPFTKPHLLLQSVVLLAAGTLRQTGASCAMTAVDVWAASSQDTNGSLHGKQPHNAVFQKDKNTLATATGRNGGVRALGQRGGQLAGPRWR